MTKLLRYLLTLVRADLNGIEAVFCNQDGTPSEGHPFFCGHTSEFHAQAFLSGCLLLFFLTEASISGVNMAIILLISRSLCC